MFRRLYGNAFGTLSATEVAAIDQLSVSHGRLVMDGEAVDVRSEGGYSACATFLSCMENAAVALGLEAAPRAYRAEFSTNYRALFPDSARHYRVDVLEASVDQHSAIWVNGDKFELSPEAIGHAEELQQAWSDLTALLKRWRMASDPSNHEQRPEKTELEAVLHAMDMAWSHFEHRYISELIGIEEQARRLIVQAVQAEKALRHMEKQRGTSDYQAAQHHLVRCVANLNAVANYKRKGRDDLGSDILDAAFAVLQRCNVASEADTVGPRAAARDAARTLAADVVASYDAMRTYLREVSHCFERVDPHLCNNAGLVARLVDWEESWEVGARYVRQVALLDGICDLVAEIYEAQRLAPALTTMFEDCDVELFLVLPRIILLCFVASPQKERAELIKSLLPHRFVGGARGPSTQAPPRLGVEFEALVTQFRETMSLLKGKAPASTEHQVAWEVLVKRAVQGADEGGGAFRGDGPVERKAVEDLMHAVEPWSLELQRHCPEDWNQCSAVLVQCLTGGAQKQPGVKFQV